MLYLNKLLPIFVLPLGWVVGLLVVGLLWRKRRWGFVVGALVVLWVTSMPAVGSWLVRRFEVRYPARGVAEVERADAILVLGGIFGPAGTAGQVPNVAESGERLEAGILLWQGKKAQWLVFTGGRMPWARNPEVEGERSRRVAEARGVPAGSIVVTREVGNTAAEARAVAELAGERGWKRIILVTSALHMPRAARLFRQAGVDFVAFPVDFRVDADAGVGLLDFLPQARGLQDTEAALRELYGIAFYAVANLNGRS
jgi:uncharacterized SAM-binding protein YcdF (DUF218 family)